MILSTMADRFEAFYLSNVPLMTPRPTHLDLMKAFFSGACELATLLALVHENGETPIEEKAAAQDRLLDEIFEFAQHMVSQGLAQQSEGANDVQPQ